MLVGDHSQESWNGELVSLSVAETLSLRYWASCLAQVASRDSLAYARSSTTRGLSWYWVEADRLADRPRRPSYSAPDSERVPAFLTVLVS